jgi:hypothetical protein
MGKSTNRCTEDPQAVIRVTRVTRREGADCEQPAYAVGSHAARVGRFRRWRCITGPATLEDARLEIERLRQAIGTAEQTMTFLRERHLTLCQIEEGGWWRLHERLLPLIRARRALRRRLPERLGGADQSLLS